MKLKKLATAFLAGLTFLGVTLTCAPKVLAASSSNTPLMSSMEPARAKKHAKI